MKKILLTILEFLSFQFGFSQNESTTYKVKHLSLAVDSLDTPEKMSKLLAIINQLPNLGPDKDMKKGKCQFSLYSTTKEEDQKNIDAALEKIKTAGFTFKINRIDDYELTKAFQPQKDTTK